jgi:hypothetical protein
MTCPLRVHLSASPGCGVMSNYKELKGKRLAEHRERFIRVAERIDRLSRTENPATRQRRPPRHVH